MSNTTSCFRPLPKAHIHPDVGGVLEPGEEVYWQEQPRGKSLWFPILVVLAILGGVAWQEGLLDNPAGLIQGVPLPALLYTALFPVVLIGAMIGIHCYNRGSTVYALTSQRVMRIFKGKVTQEATPQKLQLRGSPRRDSVRWYNVDFPPDSESRGRQGFAKVEDGLAVRELLDEWQQTKVREYDDRAEASSEAFRQHARTIGAEPEIPTDAETGQISATGEASVSARRITHPKHCFSLDVPAEWDLQIGQEYDGPLKILGITLIKRIVRPATLRPYHPGDESPWNRMTLRGGPSTGLNVKINPGRMYDADEVLNDRWGKRLGIEVKFVERNIDIAGFLGFAVVREFPAGASPMGFGTLPLPVISRQWWLSGHGLDLEVQGIAPLDSTALQQTVDLVVGSLRPGSENSTERETDE